MNTRPNKHGFPGIRKHTDRRRRPYYARWAVANNQFRYSRNFATAEEAAAEYKKLKATKQ